MTDEAELSISELRRRRAQSAASSNPASGEPAREPIDPVVIDTRVRAYQPPAMTQPAATQAGPRSARRPEKPEPTFDNNRLYEALRRNWGWLVLAAILGTGIGCGIGFWRTSYSLPITFTLRDLSTRFVPGSDAESYHPPQLSPQVRAEFLNSPELLRFVATRATPPLREKQLRSRLNIDGEKDSEIITVTLTGKNLPELLALAELYTTNAIEQSRLAQLENPTLTYRNFTNELAEVQQEQTDLSAKLATLRDKADTISPIAESAAYAKEGIDAKLKINIKEGELAQLEDRMNLLKAEPLQQYLRDAENRLRTLKNQGKLEQHPDVKRVLAEISELQQQLKDGGTAPGSGFSSDAAEAAMRKKTLQVEIEGLKNRALDQKKKFDALYANTGEFTRLKARYDWSHTFQETVERRIFEAQQYRENAEGYYKVSAPPSLENVDIRSRQYGAARGGMAGGGLGLALMFLLIYGAERLDPRLKTATDVKRVTGLPVLASLGNLDKMDEAARKAWAFRTWTILSGTLGQSPNRGTVCGLISCAPGEGRTTWIEMLVDAARQRGLEVTKLQFQHGAAESKPSEASSTTRSPSVTPETATASTTVPAITTSQKLMTAKSASVIHVQLPGLVWDLQRRIQFQEELEKWQAVPHAVVLVDLPPASVPEAILLAENLPQVLWLVDSGKSHARETRLHLETLRHARCKLVGAVLNHEPEPLITL